MIRRLDGSTEMKMQPFDSQRDSRSPAKLDRGCDKTPELDDTAQTATPPDMPPCPPDRSARQKYTERAFVIQFDPVESGRSRLRGRAELVASGEQKRFRSLKELVAFMVSALRRRTTPTD